jgi:hypothetical protein
LVVIGLLVTSFGQFLVAAGLLAINRGGYPGETRWKWYKGFGIASIALNGSVLDAVCYALTPLALSAPLTLLVLVFNQILVRKGIIVQKQEISNPATIATGVAIVGIALATGFGPKCTITPTMQEMQDFLVHPRFLFGYLIPAVTLISSTILPRILRTRMGMELSKIMYAVWYGLGSTLTGSLSNLSFKVVSIAIRVSIEGDMQFDEYMTWVFLVAAAGGAVLNIFLMNACISAAPPAYGIPVYQSMLVVTTILAGGLFYNEFAQITDPGHIVGFWLGITITVLGIVLLAKFSPPVEEELGVPTSSTTGPEEEAAKKQVEGSIDAEASHVSASDKGVPIQGVADVADVQVKVGA